MPSPEKEKGTFFGTPCRDDEEEVDIDGDGGDSIDRTFETIGRGMAIAKKELLMMYMMVVRS